MKQPKQISADTLADFRRLASQRLQKNGGISKFNYGLAKVLRATDRADKAFNTDVMDAKIEHAEVDEKEMLIKTPQGGLSYTRQGQQEMNEAIRALSNDKSYDITPYFVKSEYIPTDLTAEELMIYTGLVIEEADADTILNASGKNEESILLQKVIDMAIPSLSPVILEGLQNTLCTLAESRHLKAPNIPQPSAPAQTESPQ